MASTRKKNISGKYIAAVRQKSKLTQAELVSRLHKVGLHIDRAGIAKIENGLRSVYDYELYGLAKVLQISVNQMLGLRK